MRLTFNFTRNHKSIGLTAICFFSSFMAMAQSPFKGLENLFTTPRSYIVRYTTTPPVIDGDINDAVWQQADWTEQFQDIEGDLKPHPALQTKVKMLWGDSCLYIAAQMQEPNVWAYQQHHDDVVFYDNDFEVFINPNNTTHQYFEMEFNALNTVFDLFMNKPYRDLGSAMINWNAEGLHSAVKVQGTINNPSDTDTGWTIEIAIPFRAISIGNFVQIPREGTLWRINFSRVEWDTKVVNGKYAKQTKPDGENQPEHNWVWSQQGIVDMHAPERWGYLQFAKKTDDVTFRLPYAEQQKQYLWLVYYREQLWRRQHKAYALSLAQLGLTGNVTVNNKPNILQMEATRHLFMALITDKSDNITYTINQEGLVKELNHYE
jgi:hypothetical protein